MGSKSTKPKESAESKASPAPNDPLAMQGFAGGGNSAAAAMLPPTPAAGGRKSLPVGRVTQLDIDPGAVMAAFDAEFDAAIEKTLVTGKNFPDANPEFKGSPLEAELRPAVSGAFFQDNNHFDTGWVDDGTCDFKNLGLYDAERGHTHVTVNGPDEDELYTILVDAE